MPRIFSKNGGGDGSFLVPMWQGTQLTLCPVGQTCHPLGGELVLQETSNWEHSLWSACYRDSAKERLLEEHSRITRVGSTAGWGKGGFLYCAAPRLPAPVPLPSLPHDSPGNQRPA